MSISFFFGEGGEAGALTVDFFFENRKKILLMDTTQYDL